MENFPKRLEHSPGIWMSFDETRLLVSFWQRPDQKALFNALKQTGLVLDNDPTGENTGLRKHINNTLTRIWLRSDNLRPITDQQIEKLRGMLGEALEWIAPVYRHPQSEGTGGLFAPLPRVLLVKVAKGLETRFAKTIQQFGLHINQERSKYLAGYLYLDLTEKSNFKTVYELKDLLAQEVAKGMVEETYFDFMPYFSPLAAVPSDAFFAQQWNMNQIQGPDAWDISAGSAAVSVAVIDTGCEMNHPDIQFNGTGFNAGSLANDGSPAWSDRNHGTACAGIVAGTFNNGVGVAGVSGNCRIISIALLNATDTELATAINFAVTSGAQVISMSLGYRGFYGSIAVIDTAFTNAFANDLVICVSTGNENGPITYPALNANVMAIGASDQADNRKNPGSPDGECWWGSNFGPEQSVVAPGVLIPTTDRQGSGVDTNGFDRGYNDNAGGSKVVTPAQASCLSSNLVYPASGDASGDYTFIFNGTSAATPHVAGLAALIRSVYPALNNVQVRAIIERTAEKVGVIPYTATSGYNNGTWNNQMGYGRINAFQALDFADVFIRDYPADAGSEPSNPPGGNFWDFSDIVVRITDDGVFNPSNPAQSKNVEQGQDNFIYVQVTNNGPRDARNVTVNCRITPWVGIHFIYPQDWTLTDAMHVQPSPVVNTFATIPSGSSVLAKFKILAADTNVLYGWQYSNPWHPCLLAEVRADNDYAFATASFASGDHLSKRINNLAQRNLSVIDVLAMAGGMRAMAFPFVAGSQFDAETQIFLTVDKNRMGKAGKVLLSLDDDGSAFPLVNFDAPQELTQDECGGGGMVFLQKTKIETTLGCCRGVLTLEKGSRFDCPPRRSVKILDVKGGELIVRGGKRYVEIREQQTVIRMEKQPSQQYPLSVQFEIPPTVEKGEELSLVVSQQNRTGETVGGATAIYIVK